MGKSNIYIIIMFLSIFIFCRTHANEEETHKIIANEIKTTNELHKEEALIETQHSGTDEHVSIEVNGNGSSEHKSSEAHKPVGEHNAHAGIHEAPMEYYIMWSIVSFILVMLFGYYMKFISVQGFFGTRIADDDLEHENDIETTGFALMLVILAAIFYTLLMMPELFGYFDSQTHAFVKGYHESNANGLSRFILVTASGIMMTIYAFKGMQHH